MKRGDLVTIAIGGDYGKPRPALVVQSDVMIDLASAVIAPLTSHPTDGPTRVDVPANAATGLRVPSQIMVDKILTAPRGRIGPRIGAVDDETLDRVDRALRLLLSLD